MTLPCPPIEPITTRGVNSLFSDYVEVNTPVVRACAVFPKINALPCAKYYGIFRDGDAQVDVCQCGADVGRHVIVALVIVFVNRVSVGCETGEDRFEIGSNAGIGVFLNQ